MKGALKSWKTSIYCSSSSGWGLCSSHAEDKSKAVMHSRTKWCEEWYQQHRLATWDEWYKLAAVLCQILPHSIGPINSREWKNHNMMKMHKGGIGVKIIDMLMETTISLQNRTFPMKKFFNLHCWKCAVCAIEGVEWQENEGYKEHHTQCMESWYIENNSDFSET